MNPAAFILAAPSMCGPQKMFLFPLQTKVWPLCLCSLSFSLSLSFSPPLFSPSLSPSPSLFLFLSLCVDNVPANDLTVLVEAPSSNWTSRDWVLYRKTTVILSQISTTREIQKNLKKKQKKTSTLDWTLWTTSRVGIQERNQVCFGKMGAIKFLLAQFIESIDWLVCMSGEIHLGVKCSLGWYLVDLRSMRVRERLGNN